MPFPSVTHVSDLPPNPDIRIFFSGLMILTPDDFNPPDTRKTCVVYINRSAPDHYLTVEVRKKEPGGPDEIIMRHTGTLPFVGVGQHGLLIQLSNETPAGVMKYEGPDGAGADGQKLSHALDFKTLHATDVPPPKPEFFELDDLGGRPSILIDTGILYTAAITKVTGIKIKKKPDAPGSGASISPFASILGLNVYLKSVQQKLTLTWRGLNGIDNTLDLEKLSGNASHEIYIDNDPLFEPDDDASVPIPTHEELTEYYRIMPNMPNDQRFVLEFPKKNRGRGSARTPCMSTLLGA